MKKSILIFAAVVGLSSCMTNRVYVGANAPKAHSKTSITYASCNRFFIFGVLPFNNPVVKTPETDFQVKTNNWSFYGLSMVHTSILVEPKK